MVELLVSVAIMVLVGAISVLSFPRFLDYYRAGQAQQTLIAALRQAQLNAYRIGGSWRVTVADGVRMERASDNLSDCSADPGVWKLLAYSPFSSRSVALAESSRQCVVFGASGRVSGRLPRAQADDPDSPGDMMQAPILVDSRRGPLVPDPENFSHYWYRWLADEPLATMVIDPQEERTFRAVEVGVLGIAAGTFSFPSEIQVRGISGGNYTCLGDYTLASEDGQSITLIPKSAHDESDDCPGTGGSPVPAGTIVRGKCEIDTANDVTLCRFSIPITGRFRQLELTMVKAAGMELYVDEVDIGDLFFTLTSGKYSRTVSINPVTGRVTGK
ncbi:MAG TPA: hypothetical protein VD969_15500 [Symbiobacteriaceae bacterium]|nr:hypothetical protein [Symbiobacteriaceae bacterium]